MNPLAQAWIQREHTGGANYRIIRSGGASAPVSKLTSRNLYYHTHLSRLFRYQHALSVLIMGAVQGCYFTFTCLYGNYLQDGTPTGVLYGAKLLRTSRLPIQQTLNYPTSQSPASSQTVDSCSETRLMSLVRSLAMVSNISCVTLSAEFQTEEPPADAHLAETSTRRTNSSVYQEPHLH